MSEAVKQDVQVLKSDSKIKRVLKILWQKVTGHFAEFVVLGTSLYAVIVFLVVRDYSEQFEGLEFFAYGNLADVFRVSWFIGFSYALLAIGVFLSIFIFGSLALFTGASKGKFSEKLAKVSMASLPSALLLMLSIALVDELFQKAEKRASAIKGGADFYYTLKGLSEDKDIRCVGLIGATGTHYLVWDYWQSYIKFRAIPISSVSEPVAVLKPSPLISVFRDKDQSDEDFRKMRENHAASVGEWHERFNKFCPNIDGVEHPQSKRIQSAKVG